MFPPRDGAEVINLFSANRTAAKPAPKPELDLDRVASTWRDRDHVKHDIAAHIAARKAYQEGVSWLAAAEAENLPAANIEAAREDLRRLHAEMIEAARMLLIATPHDPKALIDLLLYLEQNFTALPTELTVGGVYGGTVKSESLAFHLLRVMRLSLRAVAKHGKVKPGA
jgi:hypothetical protein